MIETTKSLIQVNQTSRNLKNHLNCTDYHIGAHAKIFIHLNNLFKII